MTDWRTRLAIVSDEAAAAFAEAVAICVPLGIRAYELRNFEEGRFPHVPERVIDGVMAQVADHQLTLVGVSPGFGKLAVDDPRSALEVSEGLPHAFRLMATLNVQRLTVFSYLRTNAAAQPPQQVLDRLGCIATLCRAEGIELLIENSKGCWADTGEHLATIANAIDVRVTWDPANAAAAGERAFPDGYGHVRERIGHVHCKNWGPEGGNVAIADGVVDMAAQIRALKADGYSGYYTVEPHQWHDRANASRLNTKQLLTLLEQS